MAYTPINWQTGDTITAEKLNRCDNGWSVSSTQLFSETVTTSGSSMYTAVLAYSQPIDANTITVTFDSTEYECSRIDAFNQYYYGGFTEQGPVFTDYPFCIASGIGFDNEVYTETAGTYTVAAVASSLQTSAGFSAAVMAASPIDASTLPLRCVEGVTTYDEATFAMEDGRLVYFTANDETYSATPKCFMVNTVDSTCTIVPTSTKIAAKFGRDDGLFYIERLSS